MKFPMAADAKTKFATFPIYAARQNHLPTRQHPGQVQRQLPRRPVPTPRKGAVGHFASSPASAILRLPPKVPVDRGTHADASAHLIPTEFDPIVAKLLQTSNRHITCSETFVEANIIDSEGSVDLTNWSSGPVENLQVTLPLI